MKKEKFAAIALALSAGVFLLGTTIGFLIPQLRRKVEKKSLKKLVIRFLRLVFSK